MSVSSPGDTAGTSTSKHRSWTVSVRRRVLVPENTSTPVLGEQLETSCRARYQHDRRGAVGARVVSCSPGCRSILHSSRASQPPSRERIAVALWRVGSDRVAAVIARRDVLGTAGCRVRCRREVAGLPSGEGGGRPRDDDTHPGVGAAWIGCEVESGLVQRHADALAAVLDLELRAVQSVGQLWVKGERVVLGPEPGEGSGDDVDGAGHGTEVD